MGRNRLARRWPGAFNIDEATAKLHYLADRVSVTEPFQPTHYGKGVLQQTVTDLISFFANCVTIEGGVAYEGRLIVPDDRRYLCDILKKMIWYYVIRKPTFAAQQHGQQRLISDLVQWLAANPENLLPADRREELQEHEDMPRAVADHIVTLTEAMAIKLYRKLGGQDLGFVTDPV